MDPEEFDLSRLGPGRGRCPSAEELMSEDDTPFRDHLALCGLCAELRERLLSPDPALDESAWRTVENRMDRKPAPWRTPAPWRRYLPVAAILAVVTVPAVWFSSSRPESASADLQVRGAALQLIRPAGKTLDAAEFRWQALPSAAAFRITIRRQGRELLTARATGFSFRPDEELLQSLRPNQVYEWKIAALDGSGQLLEESGWLAFELVERLQ